MAVGDDDDIELGFEANEADARRAGEEAADATFSAFESRMASRASKSRLGDTVANIISKAQSQRGSERLFEDTAKRAEDASRSASDAFRRRFEQMEADSEALRLRIQATFETLEKAGANPNLFAVVNRQLRITQSVFRELEDEIESGTLGEERFERLARIVKESNATAQRELGGLQSTLRSFITTTQKDLARRNDAENRAAQERIQIQKQEGSQRLILLGGEQNRLLAAQKAAERERLVEARTTANLIAIAEREASASRQQDLRTRSKVLVDAERTLNAERLVETRTGGRLQVLAEQATSRRRIEIMRFTFRQIQALERGIAAVFRASASVISGLAGATASGLSRLGNVFRRTNRDMNDGLQAALSRREQALSRSFRRQTQDIRAEVGRQQQAVDRLERNLSSGVLGVFSGRSRLGGAVGAGALIGGGLTGANLFGAGLDRFQQLERANLQLERILGSASQAQRLLDGLNQWALGTPLALDLISEIAVGLLSIGTAAEDVIPRLEAITDAVAFTGGGAEEIRRVSLAIRQISSAGRLLGQDFNQIAQALPGLNLTQLLADQLTGGDTAAFLKLREAGEVSAQEFLEAFVAGVQQSPAIAGSTSSLATTLAGQISNLNAAWRRLGAAIITEFEGPLRASIKRTRDNLSFLARFVSGDVSDEMLRLRGAILGVATALGALIAARAAVEVLQLLGVAARFALTPFGALVVVVGALGAAIGALRVANDNVRYITDGIRDLASEQFSRGIALLGEALRRLGQFLAARVLPALQRFAETVISGVVVAVRVVVAVFRALLIPAFQSLFRFVVDTAIPAVVNLASAVQQYLIPAAIALGAAWFALNAPITTVLATFAAIAAALLILRQNSDAVRGFTDNLAQSFVNLGQRLLDVSRSALSSIADVLGEIGATFTDLLSRIDYGRLAVTVLGFVNELGRLLGAAITSRFVVDAAVKIGAAAAALAGSFLAGFVEGVVRGLPGAIDELTDTIREIISTAGGPGIFDVLFSNAFSGVATLIAGAFFASTVLRGFTSAGGRVAGAFSAGLIPGIRTGFTNAFRGIEALAGPERAMRRAAQRQAAAYQAEFDRIQRNNRRLGFQSELVGSGRISRGNLDDAALRRLNAEQQRYIEGTGRAISQATLFRRTWGDALRDTGNRWQAVQDRVAQTGGWGAVGQRAGVALVTGFAAALAGQQGGTAGLVGVVASTLGALAVGGPVVAGITAAVGGASLLIANLREADDVAKLLAETANRIADTLRGLAGDDIGKQIAENLADAVGGALDGTGADVFQLLPDGFFTNAARQIEAGGFDLERSFTSILRGLSLSAEQAQDIFDVFELDPQLLTQFLEGNFNLINSANEVDPIVNRVRADVEALSDVLAQYGVPAEAFVAALTSIQVQAEQTSVAQRRLFEETRTLADGSSAAARIIQDSIDEALAAQNRSPLEALERFDAVSAAVSRVTGLIDRVGAVGVDAFAAVQEELTRTGITLDNDLIAYVRELIDAWIAAGEAADQAQQNFQTDRIGLARFDGIGEIRQEPKITINTDELEKAKDLTSLLDAAIGELNNQRTERLRGQIDTLRRGLEFAEEAAGKARQALTDFLTGGYGDSAQAQVDNLIGNIGGIGSRIEEAFLQGGIRGQAAARSAVGDFGSQIASIIDAAIAEGVTSQEGLRNLLAPVFGALGEETGDGFSRILSTVDFTEGITPQAAGLIIDELNRILAGSTLETKVAGVFAADSEVRRIQQQLDRLEAELDVKVIFDEGQIRSALTAAGAEGALADAALASVNNLTAQQLGGLVAAVAAASAEFNPPQQQAPQQAGGVTYIDQRKVDVIVQGNPSPALTAAQVVARANALIGGGGTLIPTPAGSGFG